MLHTGGRVHGERRFSATLRSARARVGHGLREIGTTLKQTVLEWLEDGIPDRGAALSYYVLLSLGPLLVVLIGALEFFFTSAEARAGVLEAIREYIGPRPADTIGTVLQRVQVPDVLGPGSVVTLGLLVFGATAAFANLRDSLNTIWGIETQTSSTKEAVLRAIRGRLRSLAMILISGLVIVISFVLTSVSEVVIDAIGNVAVLVRVADFLMSFLFMGFLFAAMYRTLPAARIAWRSVWVGAFATALIFAIGKAVAVRLISTVSWTSYYGPAASVLTFMAWIYFSAQLFFLGAEFTKVWSRRRGHFIAGAEG